MNKASFKALRYDDIVIDLDDETFDPPRIGIVIEGWDGYGVSVLWEEETQVRRVFLNERRGVKKVGNEDVFVILRGLAKLQGAL